MSVDLFEKIIISPLGLRRVLFLHYEGAWAEASPLAGWNLESCSDIIKWLLDHSIKEISPYPSLEFARWFLFYQMAAPIKTAHLYLGNTILPIAPCIKVKSADPKILTLFPPETRFRIDCQGKPLPIDPLKPLFDRIDYIEDHPEKLSLPQASDKLGSHPIIIHKPMVKGPKIPKNKRVILSSSFESDLGLCQIAALAHFYGLTEETHGIGTLQYIDPLYLKCPAILHKGLFTPPRSYAPRTF